MIKSAAPEVIKPPRSSPFVLASNNTTAVSSSSPAHIPGGFLATTTNNAHPTSSPQTRKLIAPESLRRPQTPPTERHSSSPRSRTLAAPECLRQPHTPPIADKYHHSSFSPQAQKMGTFASTKLQLRTAMDSHSGHSSSTASPLTQHMEQGHDREIDNAVMPSGSPTLSALARSSALTGDDWLDTHSGAGSQVSIGSSSPKPQSVQRFVVDLEGSASPSRSPSQASDVDCSYIAPSKEVESVFVSSGYLYVTPPSSDFNKKTVLNKSCGDNQTVMEQPAEKEKAMKTEICETELDSPVNPTTTVLDTSSSSESTPVRQVIHSTATIPQHTTDESAMVNKVLSKGDGSEDKEEGKKEIDKNGLDNLKSVTSGSKPDAASSQQPEEKEPERLSVADKRRAFEKQSKVKENDKKPSTKVTRQPPLVPKRVSSISSVDSATTEEENITSAVQSPTESTFPPLDEEDVVEEEKKPPPPPMSTHPGISNNAEADKSSQQEEEVQVEKEDEKSKVVEGTEVKPKPKERRLSSPTCKAKPTDSELEVNDSSEQPENNTSTSVIVEGPKSSAETKAAVIILPENREVSSSVPAPLQEEKAVDDATRIASDYGDVQQGKNADTFEEATDCSIDEPPSTETFGHNVSPSVSATSLGASSKEPISEEKRELEDIDPSKKLGAEVTTFKPVPKPRSFQRHSMYGARPTPTIVESHHDVDSPHAVPPSRGAYNSATTSLLAPSTSGRSYTPEMKRSSMHFPTPENRRDIILRAQSMSMLPTGGSASPRMMVRGEQRSQMPPGFMVFSRSQEAVIGRHPSMTSNMMQRAVKQSTETRNEEEKKKSSASAATSCAAPMNTKRSTKKRKSFFRRK